LIYKSLDILIVNGVNDRRITTIAAKEPIKPSPKKYPIIKIATASATVIA